MMDQKMMDQKMMEQKTPIYNFGAGPACLPPEVLTRIKQDIPDWYEGMSVMELSHRLPVVMEMTQTIESNLRKLLSIPDDFAVLFMQGGARAQFSAAPLNFLAKNPVANYIVTGTWSKLAYEEALKYGQIHLAATSEPYQFSRIPDPATWQFADKAVYCHYADNETIHGVEFARAPEAPDQLLISDMTSNILTKTIDFSRYAMIYASAQKNLGIAGITVVIVRRDCLKQPAHPLTPSTLHYKLFEESQSLYNTPSVFCWYVLGLILEWMLAQGGLSAFIQASQQKSALLYQIIDDSGFYHNPVFPPHRSRMNVPFTLLTPELETQFLAAASQAGLKQLKGHKNVGGIRASIYNAMPMAGVEALATVMQDFEKKHA